MRTIILVASRYGSAERIAAEIGKRIQHGSKDGGARDGGSDCTIYNLQREKVPANAVETADRIIIGPSVYAGQISSKLKAWVDRNLHGLLAKPCALFVCCMSGGDTALGYLGANLPANLVAHSHPRAALGGAFQLERMRPFDRFVIRNIAQVRSSVEAINWKGIEEFARLV